MKKISERILSSLTDEDIEFTSTEKTSQESTTPAIPSDDFHTLITTILNKTNLGPIHEVNDKISELLDTFDLIPEFEGYVLQKKTNMNLNLFKEIIGFFYKYKRKYINHKKSEVVTMDFLFNIIQCSVTMNKQFK